MLLFSKGLPTSTIFEFTNKNIAFVVLNKMDLFHYLQIFTGYKLVGRMGHLDIVTY